MDKGTHYTKMSGDSLLIAEITPNAPEFICPVCLPKPKNIWIAMKKGFIGRP